MSPDVARGDGALAGPARVGADLRAARERLGWPLREVAEGLRIRASYLEALEGGRVANLPAPAYALGFLRTYASALGLDPEEHVRRFKACAAEVTRKTVLDFPVPAPERGVPTGAVALLAVLLAVGAYAGWYRLSGEGKLPAEAVQPVPERLAPLAEQAVPLAPAPKPPAQQAASGPSPVAAPPVVTEAPSMDMPSVPPSSAAAAMPMPMPASLPSAAQPATLGTGAEDGRIVLRARADTWLQVREKGGQILLNRVLHAGESWVVPAKPNLLLTMGNAGGTDVVVDGTSAPSFGGAGAVRRDLPLDPDAIRDGKLPAQVQAAAQPAGAQPAGAQPAGTQPAGVQPALVPPAAAHPAALPSAAPTQ
jgi:cytoskeleton protein RodZ